MKNSAGLTAVGLVLLLTPLLLLFPLEGNPPGYAPPKGVPGAAGAGEAGVEDDDPQKNRAAPEREIAGIVTPCLNMLLVVDVSGSCVRQSRAAKSKRCRVEIRKKRKRRRKIENVGTLLFSIEVDN